LEIETSVKHRVLHRAMAAMSASTDVAQRSADAMMNQAENKAGVQVGVQGVPQVREKRWSAVGGWGGVGETGNYGGD
jgi:hypothetical protein